MSRTGAGFAVLAIAGLAIGCSEQTTDPLTIDEFSPAADLSPGVHLLNTQLRGIIDPAIQPTPAWGHIQIKLTEDGENGFLIEWKGKLFNPANEVFSSAYIINPAIIIIEPGDGEPTVSGSLFTLFRGSDQSCGILLFGSQGITDEEHIPFEQGMDMITNPGIHEVLLVSEDGTAVSGRFGLPDPTELIGFNPQPDPPGKIVRCDATTAQ